MSRATGKQSEPPQVDFESKMKYSVELKAYEETCKIDPDVKNFDEAVQERTGRAIHAVANGIEVRSVSLETLRETIDCLLEMDQDVVKVLLECKEDIWNNRDLFELVEQYFENSLQTLDFCTVLESCLRKARNNQMIIQNALRQIPPEGPPSEAQCKKMLEELTTFKTAGSPFSEDFFKHFDSVYRRHTQMLEKLHLQRKKLDKKLRHVRAWRKVSNIIFVATFAAVLICSVVAAAIISPHVAAAIAAAVPIASGGKWIDSYWQKYEDAIKAQRVIVTTMDVGTFVAIKDLESIKVLVDSLEDMLSSILRDIEFCSREEDALRLGIEGIKQKHDSFMQAIEDLAQHADRCGQHIRKARTVLVQKMIKPAKKRSFSF